ncbi:MAG: sporulation integral membrane protein YtvI [Faecousia sp.]
MKNPWRLIGYAICGVVGIWVTVKLLLPVGLPFLLGYGLSALAEPPVRALKERFGVPRRPAGFLVVLLLSAAVFGILFLLGKLLFSQAQELTARLPSLLTSLEEPLAKLHGGLLRIAAKLPQSVAPAAAEWIDRLFAGGSVVAGTVSEWLLGFAGNVISLIPDIVLFLLTMILSAYLFCAERTQLLQIARRLLPEQWRKKLLAVKTRLRGALGGYCKAQGYLLLVTLAIVAVGLLLLRRRNALLIALLIAVVDALPVFGAGTILIPWGVISFLRGQTGQAVGLLLLYAVTSLTRTCLEPRFLGRQIGLNPLLTLVSLYAGFRLFGVIGMILVPVGVILLKQIYELVEST